MKHQAALLQFDLAQKEQAVVTARRAFQYFGRTADPSPIYCDLINRVRAFYQEQFR